MKKFLMIMTAVLILPIMLFAEKGVIIGYAAGWENQPPASQLDKLSHVIVFQILPYADGNLNLGSVPGWLGSFVTAAHQKNVKVSIAVGGWVNNVSPNHTDYASAASSTYRTNFVNNLAAFVNNYNLDGVDIDWEYPQGDTQWSDFVALGAALKAKLPGKRISCAIAGAGPNEFSNTLRSGVWNAYDAVHLMSYDMAAWPTHSDAGMSTQLISSWASACASQSGFNKEKLVLGCAFYSKNNTPGDNPASLKTKVDYCYDNGFGGVMIWELSQDLPNNTLLTAIYNANEAKGGYNGGTGGGGLTGESIELFDDAQIEWSGMGEDGGSFNITQQKPLKASLTLGAAPTDDNGDWPWAFVATYPGADYTGLNGVVIEYTADKDVLVGIGTTVKHGSESVEYQSLLTAGTNKTATLELAYFTPPAYIMEGNFSGPATLAGVSKSQIEPSISFSSENYGATANITVTSIKLYGATWVEDINASEITVSYLESGGVVKNGSATVASGTKIEIHEDEIMTLTFTPNEGYSITDVKVDGQSKGKITSYEFKNITANTSINVVFTKDGTEPGEGLDLADGSWGDNAWSTVSDEGVNGSSVSITKQGVPLTATWTLGEEPIGDNIPDDAWPYASVGFYTGENDDWSGVSEIVINYSVNQPTYIALSSSNEHEYFVPLETGQNKTMTILVSDFQKFDWDGGAHSLLLPEVNGIVISAQDSYGETTNLTVTSLIVKGLVLGDEVNISKYNAKKTPSKAMNAGVLNGKLNLSLPMSAKTAAVMLFDVRGRMIFNRQISLNSGVASIALPRNIAQNQAVILQVKTNSGVNLTKRVLIK